MNPSHARAALLNCGKAARFPETTCWTAVAEPPLLVLIRGSGKPGTPWLRMHSAYFTAMAAKFDPDWDALPFDGLLFDDPQPAANSAAAASAMMLGVFRMALVSCDGSWVGASCTE